MNKDNPLKQKRNIKDWLDEWKDDLKSQGLKAFWPSWMQGQYIKPSNLKAQARMRRKATYKKTTHFFLLYHKGRLIKVEMPKKKFKGPNLTTIQKKINKEFDRRIKWQKYYSEDNALNAIARMLITGGTRAMRRTLAKRLNICKFGKWKSTYKEAEFMLMEQDNFSGPGFDGIKFSYGKK